MNRIVAIVEGQTEHTFVRDQLATHLGALGTTILARLLGKGSGRGGGVKKWESARGDIIRTLKEGCYCTTMFDFYGLPDDWPGRTEAANKDWTERGQHVESAVMEDIAASMGDSFNRSQFIPYIQIHEFEALLFTDVEKLATSISPVRSRPVGSLEARFRKIVEKVGNPEAINDNYETCPSRRITSLVPGYKKAIDGPIAAQKIGLETLREHCQHFADWLGKLEKLSG